MHHSDNDLPGLFRSLKPDKADLQNDAAMSAKAAEQKWPLLRNMSPNIGELPPALSADDRLSWTNTDGAAKSATRKPALSLPGLGEKMAKSLERMSTKVANVVPPHTATRAESQPPRAEAPAPGERKQPPSKANATPIDLVAAPFAALNMKLDSPAPASGNLTSSLDVPSDKTEPAQAENSLAQVFSRLEGKKNSAKRPPVKSASFMGRLGKR